MEQDKRKIGIAVTIGLGAVLCVWLATTVSSQQIQQWLDLLGQWAVPGYILLFTLLPALFFPVAILALAGGMAFGAIWGSIYTFVGAMLNCALMFLLARYLARDRGQQWLKIKLGQTWLERMETVTGKKGFALLVLLRLIPAVPYNAINYAFGLGSMSLGQYLAASAVGIIPGTVVFINVGDKVAQPGSQQFLWAVLLLVALVVVTGVLGRAIFGTNNQQTKGETKNET